jgi:hypothetical protein
LVFGALNGTPEKEEHSIQNTVYEKNHTEDAPKSPGENTKFVVGPLPEGTTDPVDAAPLSATETLPAAENGAVLVVGGDGQPCKSKLVDANERNKHGLPNNLGRVVYLFPLRFFTLTCSNFSTEHAFSSKAVGAAFSHDSLQSLV